MHINININKNENPKSVLDMKIWTQIKSRFSHKLIKHNRHMSLASLVDEDGKRGDGTAVTTRIFQGNI